MASTRPLAVLALALVGAVACNALLDNEPRHLAPSEGGQSAQGGYGAEAAEGGAQSAPIGGGATASEGGAGVSAAGAPSGGDGGGPTCDGCSLEHATSTCRDGTCEIVKCEPGFLDQNSMPGDGCEAGDVPSGGLLLWFMADQGLSSPGGQVNEWIDQSSAHVKATATGGAMPKRVLQASGPPMVEFDGADDGLKMPEGFSAFDGISFFAVVEAYPADVCAGILSLSNGNDADDIELGRHTANLLYYEVLGDYVEGAANAFEANKRLLVSITQTSDGAVELRINGVLNASRKTIPLPKAVVRTQNFVGRDTYVACPQAYKGLLGELALFSRGVSAAEYARIQTYLATKWSIAVSAP